MQNFSVEIDYDDKVENLIVAITLTVREDPKKLKIYYKGALLQE
jgi:hypothetical protein